MRTTLQKKFILGIDIGGTKIDAKLFEIKGGVIQQDAVWELEEETLKGVETHAEQVALVVAAAVNELDGLNGTMSGIGIGSPGRFDMQGNIKPGTNPSLGKTIEEFDGANLQEKYRTAITHQIPELAHVPLSVHNDGSAMLAGLIEGVSKNHLKGLANQTGEAVNKYSLPRKHVGLFGIGTGIGHAIAAVENDGSFKFVTDGHASKLRLKVDDEDMPTLLAVKQRMEQKGDKEEILLFEDNTVRAEDVFRGPVIDALAGVTNGREIDIENPTHKAALQFAGKYMARTVALIKTGVSEDVEPNNGWTNEDKQEAAKTSHYFVGGGMGSSPLGKHIIGYAAKELEALGVNDIQLIQAPESSAARAAAALIPESVYREASIIGR